MCQSRAQGGKRCAAHTRPAYRTVIGGLPGETTAHTSQADRDTALARRLNNGYEAVIAYASTPSGMNDVKRDHDLLVDQYAASPSTTAKQERARQETLSNLRTAITAAQHILDAEHATRPATNTGGRAHTKQQAEQARQERHARHTQAEEVIWCLNHGYTADAQAQIRSYQHTFGTHPPPETDFEAAKPSLLQRISGRTPDTHPSDDHERHTHANLVMNLINDGRIDEAAEQARTFGHRYGTGYSPTMATDLAALRARRK